MLVVVIALHQKRLGESNGALVDNTEGLSCFGIRDYLGNYCPSLPNEREGGNFVEWAGLIISCCYGPVCISKSVIPLISMKV